MCSAQPLGLAASLVLFKLAAVALRHLRGFIDQALALRNALTQRALVRLHFTGLLLAPDLSMFRCRHGAIDTAKVG